jgi:hypothetical protein
MTRSGVCMAESLATTSSSAAEIAPVRSARFSVSVAICPALAARAAPMVRVSSPSASADWREAVSSGNVSLAVTSSRLATNLSAITSNFSTTWLNESAAACCAERRK